jgi:cyclohexadienyl dehydratase
LRSSAERLIRAFSGFKAVASFPLSPFEIGRQMLQRQLAPVARNPQIPMIPACLQRPLRFASRLFACVLLGALIGPAHAETTTRLDAIVGGGVLRVGMTEDYRPFSFADASGKVEGLDVDMAMSLAQSLGVKLEIVKTSWSTLKADLEANSFDIAMGGISVTLDRQKIGLFSTPVFSSGKTPITHCGDEPKYGTIAAIDQPGVNVIVNPGGTNERFDRAHLQKATIVQWSDNATIFDALVEGKADLMITDAVKRECRRNCIRAFYAQSIRTRRSTIRNSPTGCPGIRYSRLTSING